MLLTKLEQQKEKEIFDENAADSAIELIKRSGSICHLLFPAEVCLVSQVQSGIKKNETASIVRFMFHAFPQPCHMVCGGRSLQNVTRRSLKSPCLFASATKRRF